jgi:hypothetical protein
MGHNSGRRLEDMKIAALRARETAARDAEARLIVEKWNLELSGRTRPQFSPTLEAAFRARRPWLQLYCPGCQQQYESTCDGLSGHRTSRSWAFGP